MNGPPTNWAAVHRARADRFSARPAVRDVDGAWTYAQLFDAAAGIAAHLVAAGAQPGEHVATLFRNSRLAVAASYATQIAGAAETPLNSASSDPELLHAARLAGVRHVLTTSDRAPLFAAAGFIVHDAARIPPGPLDPSRFPAVSPDLPGRLAFTSGTTGLPKAIVYSQAARFLANILLQSSLPHAPADTGPILLPTPFAHGASLQCLAWLDRGGEVVLHDGADPGRIRPMLEAGGLGALFAPPTVLAKLTAAFAGRSFASIRTVFSGTAPLPPTIYAAARRLFGPVVRLTYGKSEVINPITVLPPEETDRWYIQEQGGADGGACVGWPAPGVEIALEDGEVLLRARHMSDGYIDASGFHPWRPDGFHPTGDIGRIDERGRLHLLARVADAIKTGGYKVYPQEIERPIADSLGATEFAIVGLPSDYWGEIVTLAAVAPRPGWEDAARAACAGLAAHKRPRLFATVPFLPRNAQGKLVRRILAADIIASHRLTDGPRPTLEPSA